MAVTMKTIAYTGLGTYSSDSTYASTSDGKGISHRILQEHRAQQIFSMLWAAVNVLKKGMENRLTVGN